MSPSTFHSLRLLSYFQCFKHRGLNSLMCTSLSIFLAMHGMFYIPTQMVEVGQDSLLNVLSIRPKVVLNGVYLYLNVMDIGWKSRIQTN